MKMSSTNFVSTCYRFKLCCLDQQPLGSNGTPSNNTTSMGSTRRRGLLHKLIVIEGLRSDFRVFIPITFIVNETHKVSQRMERQPGTKVKSMLLYCLTTDKWSASIFPKKYEKRNTFPSWCRNWNRRYFIQQSFVSFRRSPRSCALLLVHDVTRICRNYGSDFIIRNFHANYAWMVESCLWLVLRCMWTWECIRILISFVSESAFPGREGGIIASCVPDCMISQIIAWVPHVKSTESSR